MWPFSTKPTPTVARKEPSLSLPERKRVTVTRGVTFFDRAAEPPPKAFTVAQPMPGVLPAGMAMDEYGYGDVYNGLGAFPLREGDRWMTFTYLAELSQIPEYRIISETIAKEMTRRWIRISATGDDDKSDRVAALNDALDRFQVQDKFRQIAEQDGLFGRSHLFFDFGQGDKSSELGLPLIVDPRKIKKGSLKEIRVIEPMWVYPAVYNARTPLLPDYYRPKSWFVQGVEVHRSRLLTFVSREMPDLLKPAYSFAGISLTQMAKRYVDNWLQTRQSVSNLIQSFSVSGIKTNMQATINAGGAEEIEARVKLFNAVKSNGGAMILDKETEEFFNVSTPLSSLDLLQAQSQEHIAAVSGIPLVKLFGISPTGLNATAEPELRSFYESINARQEHLFSCNLRVVLDVIQLSEFGDIDQGITFSWEPLWMLDDAARAAVRKTNADSAAVMIDSGVLSPEEERKRLATEDDGLYNGLDPDDVPEPPAMEESIPGEHGDPARSAELGEKELEGV